MKRHLLLFLIILCAILFGFTSNDDLQTDWTEYLGGKDRNHFSRLNQITKENVHQLKIAWTYVCADSGQMQTNPLVVKGRVFGVSPTVQAFALDASTGKEIWTFGDPLKNWASTSRGVSYWSDGKEERILYTVGPKLWALDAKTGKPIQSFGKMGNIDLHEGLPAIAKDKFIISNTPGTIFQNLIIMPVRLSEGEDAAPGDIRAFDVLTGKLIWTFHTIPYPGEFGYKSFPKNAYKNKDVGAANNWAGMALDEKNGIVFVPTGSAGYDFYGANRKGKNLFSDCLLALDAKTGKRLWHYQFVHHDLWDRDMPAPPNLIQVLRNGKKVDAVAQITKQGFVYLFERKTGKPLFDIKEIPVPKSNLKGELAWGTQPRPALPAPYAREASELTSLDINPYSSEKAQLTEVFKRLDRRWFAPPSEVGTMILPGFDGGGEWGGAAAHPSKGIIYINSNEMPWIQKMEKVQKGQVFDHPGEKIYQNNCASCHKNDLSGNPASGYPKLADIYKKRNAAFLNTIISSGKGMMPGFPQIKGVDKDNLVAFLMKEASKEAGTNQSEANSPILYRMAGYRKFVDKEGLPGIAPPWGTLNAIDLNTGKYLWKVNFGDEPLLASRGIKGTGTENYGGPILFENGLLLIAASKDGFFRAYDAQTGKEIWKYKLPFASFATPATYMVNGKQYVVLACGGTKLGTPKGNVYVAFSL
ncbi:MAG: hypothetical protein RJA76_174 [Bacteroidota bacterium]|jgi:quinoprotein glucose dehydrogenase